MKFDRRADRKKLTLAISAALVMGSASADFASTLELSSLNGTNGFKLNGASAGDESGTSVRVAGDINGDGIDDLLIGAPLATTSAAKAGKSYLLFGSNQAYPDPLNLSSLNGTNGIVIHGESVFDYSGFSVSAAGDINGDGIDDLVIGAPSASPDANYSGASYVVFGDNQGLPSPLDLSTINGSNGFVVNGINDLDESGTSVGTAGDINDDGIDDLIIGAPFASGGDGAGYVIFGNNQPWTSLFELSALNGANGFSIRSVGNGDTLGISVSAAGDVNGDGIDDLIIGAILAGTEGDYSGAGYVVFGSAQVWGSSLDLSALDGSNGFVIEGVTTTDEAGTSVSTAGDINGDGIADLIIGAPKADPNGDDSGASYVVFGSNQAWSTPISLSGLNGSNGFVLNGVTAGDRSGTSVGLAGDINLDGIDDVIVGAPRAGPNGAESGASYVVFGSDQGWSASINLSSLNGTNGFVINGVNAGDRSGGAAGSAGDLNNDGKDDMVVGARLADPNGDNSGASYVVFDLNVVNEDIIFADSFEK